MASVEFRQSGNRRYWKALEEGLAPALRLSRLQDATKLYQQAVDAAVNPKDRCSAIKNLGKTTKRMAEVYLEEERNAKKGFPKTLTVFKESLKLMNEALHRGATVMEEEWRMHLEEEMQASLKEIMDITTSFNDHNSKMIELCKVARLLSQSVMTSALARFNVADELFKESVRLLEAGDYKRCLGYLHDMNKPIEEALRILRECSLSRPESASHKLALQGDLEILQQDAYYQICSAESIQARKIGEVMLEEILKKEEYIRMGKVLNAVDWFKQASLKAAEVDIEQEAAAMSYLGLMHEKIFLSKTKTKLYYRQCLNLAEAAKPRMFTSHKWYTQCVTGYKKIQDEERQRDEVAQQNIRQEILDTMEDEIKALKKANTSAASLLEHVLKHHPSPKKTGKFTKTQLEKLRKTENEYEKEIRKTRKKLLLKALQEFHPDKIVKASGETEEDMKKRKVLTEEISKIITAYYERVKLVD